MSIRASIRTHSSALTFQTVLPSKSDSFSLPYPFICWPKGISHTKEDAAPIQLPINVAFTPTGNSSSPGCLKCAAGTAGESRQRQLDMKHRDISASREAGDWCSQREDWCNHWCPHSWVPSWLMINHCAPCSPNLSDSYKSCLKCHRSSCICLHNVLISSTLEEPFLSCLAPCWSWTHLILWLAVLILHRDGQSTRPQYLSNSTNTTGQNLLRYK